MSNYKSITVIVGDYPAPGHMMMVFVQQLVHAIIEQGVRVRVIAPQSLLHALMHGEKILPRRAVAKTETGWEYEIFRPYTLSFGNVRSLRRLSDWCGKHAIVSILKKVDVEVLYAHFWSNALPVYEYAITHHKPLFVACGEGDNALEEMIKSIPSDRRNRLAKAVAGVVSVSSENKRKCVRYGLADEKNIRVIPNCVNTRVFHKMEMGETKKKLGIKDRDFVISFVGGFIHRKGPDRIAQAIRVLNDPHIKVLFIGKPFPGYAYDFDCPGIIFKGSLDHDLIPQYVNCSDVFVMPTQKEGCCNAVVEALAMGVPVISSNRPFNEDILNDKNSILVDPDDVGAIAEAIKTLRDNVELRKSMSEYSLSHHEEYSITGRAKRILSFIDRRIVESK